ncbi:rRNA-processing protein [Pichia kluyveri]|uniref:Protein BFR2 n=1 Tax=Pichia kluyveri TaxID=36015 RepID=A0AAV5R0L6_PICKL|nr:rRNA-processing protein [Pichia kluyveri]
MARGSGKMLGEKLMDKLNRPKVADYDIENADFVDKNNGKDINGSDDGSDDDEEEEKDIHKRDHYVSVGKSSIRSDVLGGKYTGSKVGRNEVFENNDDDNDDDDDNEIESDEGIDIEDSEDDENVEEENDESEEDDEQSEDEDIEEEEFQGFDDETHYQSDEDTYKREKIEKLLESEKQQIISRLSTSAKSDAIKGYTILKQSAQYDRILDSRIKLQKAIVSSNNLPINYNSYQSVKTESSDKILNTIEDKLFTLIERLTNIRANQLQKDSLIKNKIDINLSSSKKRKLSDYLETNKKIDDIMVPITKSVLNKWSDRVQSASGIGALNQGKFSVINQSVWSQVNNQLSDLERFVKKTKINRRNATPIGYNEEDEKERNDEDSDEDSDEEQTAGLSNIDKSLQINPYIFDDDDFYKLLLNDMINKKLDQKQASNSAILMLSKNKMQKNYDRMATKGRKLKYTVQEPIAQFDIPRRKYYSWNDDQIDELFAGLFGVKFNMDDSDNDNDNDNDDNVEENEQEDISALKQSGLKLFG